MFLKHSLRLLAALVVAALPSVASAGNDALSVMTQSRELRRGLVNSVSDVTMEIRDTSKRSTIRRMRQYVLEVPNAGNQTINVFSWPADVNGVSILTHSGLTGDDDMQWLFLPSFKRVRRIASSDRSGAFVGSEFAYEDLTSFEVEKYTYGGVSHEQYAGKDVLVVESKPRYGSSGYSRLRTFLDPSNYQPVRIEYFNRRNEHFKTLELTDYKAYAGKSGWRSHQFSMTNHSNGRTTVIKFEPFRPSPEPASVFNANKFQQAR
jgi:hypothetical protein